MTSKLIAVNFHGIGSPGRALEAGEEPYWVSRGKYEAVLDMIAALPDPELVRISFDDGNLSDFEIGLPLLLERNLRANFFLLTGRLGLPGYLNIENVRQIKAAGMGIGSHGVNHLNWSELRHRELEAELSPSRARLEDICGSSITSASIPFGAYNRKVIGALSEAGYTCAYSSDGGLMRTDTFLRPRTSIREKMSLEEVALIVGNRNPIRRAARRWIRMARIHYIKM